jgi:hypothetical protein
MLDGLNCPLSSLHFKVDHCLRSVKFFNSISFASRFLIGKIAGLHQGKTRVKDISPWKNLCKNISLDLSEKASEPTPFTQPTGRNTCSAFSVMTAPSIQKKNIRV